MGYVKDLLVTEENKQKWFISLLSGILFCLIASPSVFKITSKLFKNFTDEKIEENGKPTKFGILVHTIIFVLISRFLMEFEL